MEPDPLAPPDLVGRWRFERTVDDRYAGQRLRVEGEALLAPVDGDVRWDETGLLRRDGADPVEVRRTLLLVRAGSADPGVGWRVTFEDGRPFHPWTPGSEVDHPCLADRYRGLVVGTRATGGGPTGWRTTWWVAGPTKDHTIVTDYRRR